MNALTLGLHSVSAGEHAIEGDRALSAEGVVPLVGILRL